MKKQFDINDLGSVKSILLYCSPGIDFLNNIFRFSVVFDQETTPTYDQYSSVWISNANQRVTSTIRIPVPPGKISCKFEVETDEKNVFILDTLILEGVDVNDRPVFHAYPDGFLEKLGSPSK